MFICHAFNTILYKQTVCLIFLYRVELCAYIPQFCLLSLLSLTTYVSDGDGWKPSAQRCEQWMDREESGHPYIKRHVLCYPTTLPVLYFYMGDDDSLVMNTGCPALLDRTLVHCMLDKYKRIPQNKRCSIRMSCLDVCFTTNLFIKVCTIRVIRSIF